MKLALWYGLVTYYSVSREHSFPLINLSISYKVDYFSFCAERLKHYWIITYYYWSSISSSFIFTGFNYSIYFGSLLSPKMGNSYTSDTIPSSTLSYSSFTFFKCLSRSFSSILMTWFYLFSCIKLLLLIWSELSLICKDLGCYCLFSSSLFNRIFSIS